MRVSIGFLTRRERGAPARRSVEADAQVLRVGRGAANEIALPDLRVPLVAAEISGGAAGLRIKATVPGSVLLGGRPVVEAAIGASDEIRIGPYRLATEPPAAGFDAAVVVELVDPAEDDLQRLKRTSRVGLERTRLGKRLPSWLLFLLIAAFGLALPIVSYTTWGPSSGATAPKPEWSRIADLSWNVGEVSDAHKHFSADCGACHLQSFASVPDKACLDCHTGVPGHAGPTASKTAGLDSASCGDCHVEHRGAKGSIIADDRLCIDCHGREGGKMAGSSLSPVAGFPTGHPAFRVTVVKAAVGPVLERVALSGPVPPRNLETLKFPHDAHLKKAGVVSPRGLTKLDCAACHQPDAGRQGFRPTSFETDCAWCHTLKFDAKAPGRSVPHGAAAAVRPYLEDAYSRIALQGGDAEIPAPFQRRRVGEAVPETERLEMRAWVDARVAEALDLVFDPRRGCGSCHIATRSGDSFTVAPVVILDSHLPKTRFDHNQHETMACGQCHKAEQSASSADVLMPDIDNCAGCHGPPTATLKVPSGCISCHGFHLHGMEAMAKTRQER